MTETRKDIFETFLSLLRAGMWQCSIDNAATASMDKASWAMVMKIAEAQSVTGIVADGMNMLPPECDIPENLAMQIAAKTFQIERRNEQLNKAMAKVVGLLDKQGIKTAILKGQGVGQLYAVPEHRQCGDVDLFFTSDEERERAAEVVERELGLELTRLALDSVNFECDSVEFEMHTHLFDFSSPKATAMACAADDFRQFSAGAFTGHLPCPMNQLLCLNSHIAKHALSMGIGIRQICDYAMACREYHDKIDQKRYAEVLQTAGLRRWNEMLQTFIVDYLGVKEEWLPTPMKRRDASKLLELVKESGNFGKHREGRKELIERQNKLLLKADTAKHVIRNLRFALSIAPGEALKRTWTILKRALLNYGK